MFFSQRTGKAPVRAVQRESMDDALRNSLWNVIFECLGEAVSGGAGRWTEYNRALREKYLKIPLHTAPWFDSMAQREVWEFFSTFQWHQVYDILELTYGLLVNDSDKKLFARRCNEVLERENSAYRLVQGIVTQAADDVSLEAIDHALETAADRALVGVREHLEDALRKLSDRKAPDYRNSIKESISAVESLVRTISGDPSSGLAKALKVIESRVGLHGALKSGFLSIYGYTSDADGIRHAIMDEPNVHFEDALYMLVACSAFVDYLVAKCARGNVALGG